MRNLRFTILLLLVLANGLKAQFNNEWIDYSKTYYKFYIASPGIYRINKSVLDAAGIGNTQAQYFQLYRNGVEIPVYTSVASGTMGTADFIEFYGDKNDGMTDKALYRVTADHLNEKASLFTDTAAYFLTVNTAGNNKRIASISNGAASSSLTPLSYVWKNVRHDYKTYINGQPRPYVNRGYAVNFGEYVYSSAFDKGEMMSSDDIFPDQNGIIFTNSKATFSNLMPYTGGSLQAKVKVLLAGSSPGFPPTYSRVARILLNGNTLWDISINQFDAKMDSVTNVSPTQLSGSSTVIGVKNTGSNINDRFVAAFVEIDYPRLPDAGNSTLFDFFLKSSASDVLLELSNFNHGGVAPVLQDVTTGLRMEGFVDGSGKVKFLIPAAATDRRYMLAAGNASGIKNVTALTSKTYTNFSLSANQGNFLIVTNSKLLGGTNNPIDQYRQYRNSATGGGYNTRIYTIDELVDQFAFGIKMHPLSVKNFLRFARNRFATAPQFCFLIGRGTTYDEFRANEDNPKANDLELVPTFGYPASDVLLGSDDLTATPGTAIGRLSAINSNEVSVYLSKVKEFEAAQANPSTTQADKSWMKNVVHVVGANDASIESLIRPYMENYKMIIQDTMYGGRVTTFNKFNTSTASTIENEMLAKLFEQGFSLMTYFGHSSASALDYNLDDPSKYNNVGKYPVFLLNGCNAGNFFTFDTTRLTALNTISEKYVLAPSGGAIAMIASTHFGVVSGLNVYSTGFYRSVTFQSYNKPVSRNMKDAISYLYGQWGVNDYLARVHSEQQTLHGDPSVKVNAFAKPDYSVEASNIVINPSFLSIAETNFKAKIYYYNLGKAINDSMVVEVKRQYPQSSIYPNGFTETVYSQKVKATLSLDSLELTLPIFPERDKGINKIIVTLDTKNALDEISEFNNTTNTEFVIYEDELRPVYPYNFAIINKQNIKLVGSTSDPLGDALNYRMEIDTTELFNSAAKVVKNINSKGGYIEFDPGITFRDSTVYYWRLGIVRTGDVVAKWNNASFVYLNGTSVGFNQSHFYQHTKSAADRIYIDSATRTWKYKTRLNNVFVNHSIYPITGTADNDFSVSVNNTVISASVCVGHSMVFNVFDPVTFKPWKNYPGGAYGSGMNNCVSTLTRQYNFEWDDRDTGNRHKILNFMDAIPNGSYVLVRKILDQPYDFETFAEKLKSDEQYFGAGNSVYHRLKSAGFAEIDSFKRPRIYIFLYKKNDLSFTPVWKMSEGLYDRIQMNVDCPTPDSLGYITSPLFGPAKAWQQVLWRGSSIESGNAGDKPLVDVIGVNSAGAETLLSTINLSQQDFNISNVSALQYPYIKLRMSDLDTSYGTPYQLRWWRLYYTPVPEGALAPSILLQSKDTLEMGELMDFKIAFKNISEAAFDSLRLKAYILDRNNITHLLTLPRKKPLISGDTITVSISIDTKTYPGMNTLYLAVNPDNDQPEQFFFNNFLYKSFYVKEDTYNPLLDVTFDGTRILNRDIVSAKPHIQIKLKDESRYLALNDTAGLTIKLKFPNESTPRVYRWGTDTLQFTPANLSSGDNTATVDFLPSLTQDTEGTEYELTVSGKDRNANRAGNLEYRVTFQVFNKPMISNLLNYPNPFSTSTAFVFTITGQEVPQEFKIQIMTMTGKIVKEIPRQELGNIHIGTNVTEYKWDGTDTYGQKLGNGVYLYRVVSSLNGAKMDKFRLNDGFDQGLEDVTDKYFNKGYGKMVILR